MGEGKKGQNCPPQGTEILTKDKVRNGPNYAPKVPAAEVFLMVFSLMLEKNIYENYHLCSVLNMDTTASGPISSTRRISQSHITSLQGSPTARR